MICVIAVIRVVPGKRQDLLQRFRELLPEVQAEAGCIEYFPVVDFSTNLPAQRPIQDDRVVVLEKWDSMAALEAHLIAPHMIRFRNVVKDLIVGVELEVLSPEQETPSEQ